VRTTDFDLSEAQVRQLVDGGRKFTSEYFKWFNNPAADPTPLNRV